MLSTPNVTSANGLNSATQAGGAQAPEAEGFDFLSYLLGLQANTITETTTEDPSALSSLGQKEETEESMEQSKDLSQWNQIFPGLNLGNSSTISAQGASKGEMNVGEHDLSAKLSSMALRSQLGGSTGNLPAQAASAAGAKGTGPSGEEVGTSSSMSATERENAFQKYGNQAVSEKNTVVESRNAEVSSIAGLKKGLSIDEELHKKRATSAATTGAEALMAQTKGAADATDVGMPQIQEGGSGTSVPEMFEGVKSMIHQGGGRMTVHLSPPELGDVQIQVTARGKRVEIEMTSDNDMAKSIIESKLGDLKQSMQSQDLILSKMEVNVSHESSAFGESSFSNLSNGSGFQQSQQGSGNNQRQGGNSGLSQFQSQTSRLSQEGAQAYRSQRTPGKVDIRI